MPGAQRESNGNAMKKTSPPPGKARHGDAPRPEYLFDYAHSRSNRFAAKLGPQTVAVVLESDVAQGFHSSRSVNKLLRSVIAAVPNAKGRRKAS
jgi:hypothetical protein